MGGAAPSHVFTQKSFQFYNLRTSSGSLVKLPHPDASVNANVSVVKGGALILGLQVDGTVANPPSTNGHFRYQLNGTGGYVKIPDTFGVGNIAMFGNNVTSTDIPSEGTAVSSCLSGALTVVNGIVVRTANAIPNFDLSQDSCITIQAVIKFDTDFAVDDFWEFRFYLEDGTVLDAYDVTPKVTGRDLSGSGF